MTINKDPTFTLSGNILGETEKAIRFSIHTLQEDGTSFIQNLPESKTEWFPLSQTRSITHALPGETDQIRVTKWILSAKGFSL